MLAIVAGGGEKLQHPRPCGITPSGSVLFIERLRDRVRRVDPVTNEIALVAGGERGFEDGERPKFAFPSAASASGDNFLLVADRDNRRVRRVDVPSGAAETVCEFDKGVRPCAVVALGRSAVYATVTDDEDGAHAIVDCRTRRVVAGAHGERGLEDGPALDARFSVIYDVAAYENKLFVADGNRIRCFDPSTNLVSTVAGSPKGGARDGPATDALFCTVRGIAFDRDGTLYVSDFANNQIRVVEKKIPPPRGNNASSPPVDDLNFLHDKEEVEDHSSDFFLGLKKTKKKKKDDDGGWQPRRKEREHFVVRTLVGNVVNCLPALTTLVDDEEANLPCPCSLALDDERGRLYVGTGDDFIVKINVPSFRQRRRAAIIQVKLLFWLAQRHRAFLRRFDTAHHLGRLLEWLVNTPASGDLVAYVCEFAF